MSAPYSCSVEHYAAHVALHREWTDAVGTPGYDKRAWKERERLLHVGCRGGCLVNPPPLPDEGSR